MALLRVTCSATVITWSDPTQTSWKREAHPNRKMDTQTPLSVCGRVFKQCLILSCCLMVLTRAALHTDNDPTRRHGRRRDQKAEMRCWEHRWLCGVPGVWLPLLIHSYPHPSSHIQWDIFPDLPGPQVWVGFLPHQHVLLEHLPYILPYSRAFGYIAWHLAHCMAIAWCGCGSLIRLPAGILASLL